MRCLELTLISGYEDTITTPIRSTGQQCNSSVRFDSIAPNSWLHLNLVDGNTKCPSQNGNGKYTTILVSDKTGYAIKKIQ